VDLRPLVHPNDAFPYRRATAQWTERSDGAYEPNDFMKAAYISPKEAVKPFNDLGAKYGLAIH